MVLTLGIMGLLIQEVVEWLFLHVDSVHRTKLAGMPPWSGER